MGLVMYSVRRSVSRMGKALWYVEVTFLCEGASATLLDTEYGHACCQFDQSLGHRLSDSGGRQVQVALIQRVGHECPDRPYSSKYESNTRTFLKLPLFSSMNFRCFSETLYLS